MSRRRLSRAWLVALSIAAHLAVGVGMFASGIWRLERLESDHRLAGIAVMATPAAAGSPADLPAQRLRPKPQRKVVKDPVQPVKPRAAQEAVTDLPATEPGNGKGTGTGDGDQPDGPPDTTGTCTTPPCGEATDPQPAIPVPPRPPVVPRLVAPTVLQHLRLSGETQLHPSTVTKQQMQRDGRERATGILKVCVSATGAISSVSVLQSTKYPAFDATLLAGVRGWRYRPHSVDGRPVPVCGMVSFVYTMK